MKKIREKLKSVRVRLFVSFCIVVTIIVLFLIIINNVVLETFYLYTKTKAIQGAYVTINDLYNKANIYTNIEDELNRICMKNDFDILIENDKSILLFSSDTNLTDSIEKINEFVNSRITSFDADYDRNNIVIFADDNMIIRRINDAQNSMNYIFLSAMLDNGYHLYIRLQVESIQESVKISNNLLISVGAVSILVAGILASFISRKFTEPILELNDIAKNMSK